jgi:hypothetical protein
MRRPWLIALLSVFVLVCAGPGLIALLHAALPLVLVLASVAIVLRLVWHITQRY